MNLMRNRFKKNNHLVHPFTGFNPTAANLMVSLESDARFEFELEKEWGSMPPDKKLDGEHALPEFVSHVHVVDT